MQRNVDTYRSPTEPDTAGPCPGKCNAAYRTAERSYNASGADHDFEPTEGQPVWCSACTTAIRAAIADWPNGTNDIGLAARLVEEVESGVSAALTEYVSGSKNRPVHDHEAASFLLNEFAEWISAWERTVRVERRLAKGKPTVDPQAAIDNACAFLLPHLAWHLTETGGRFHDVPAEDVLTEFGRDVLHFHRRAQVITGTQEVEPVRIVGVVCKNCKHKALEHEVEGTSAKQMRVTRFIYADDGEILIQRDGDDRPVKLTETVAASMEGAALGYIRCRRCRPTFRMTLDEYHAWVRLLAAGEDTRARATKEKLAEIFGNTVPTQYRPTR